MKYTSAQISQNWNRYLSMRHSVQKRQIGGQVADPKTFSLKYNTVGERSMDLKLPKITDPSNNKFGYSSDIIDLGTDKYKSIDADYNGKLFNFYAGTALPYKTQNDTSLLNPYIGAGVSLGNFDLGTEYDSADKTINASVDYNFKKGGKVSYKKKKKEEEGIASADAQVEHGRSSASHSAASAGAQHRAGGGIVEGKPGIDTNDAKLRPGSFVVPKKKVPDAIKDGILRPKLATKFQDGGVPVKLTAGEGIISPEKAARLHMDGVDLNEYAPDTEYPYTPETADSLLGMQFGGTMPPGERMSAGNDTEIHKGSRLILPQDKLFEMGRQVGVGIDIHGKDTTMTFPQVNHSKMTWTVKNKEGIYDPHASLTTGMGYNEGGGIHIKKKNRGSLHKHLGIPQGEKIPASELADKPGDSPAIKKKKLFARNARKWKHDDGGQVGYQEGGVSPYVSTTGSLTGFAMHSLTNPAADYKGKQEKSSTENTVKTETKATATPVVQNRKIVRKTKTASLPANAEVPDVSLTKEEQAAIGAQYMWNTRNGTSFDRMQDPTAISDTVKTYDPKNDEILQSANKKLKLIYSQNRNKGGKIKLQDGGLMPAFSDASLNASKDESDPFFHQQNKNDNLLGLNTSIPQDFKPTDLNGKQPSLLNTPFTGSPFIPVPVGNNGAKVDDLGLILPGVAKNAYINFNNKPVTADENANRLKDSILGKAPLNTPDNSTANPPVSSVADKTPKPPLSLFDQLRNDQKKYYDVTAATDLALLAGNLGSKYIPTPKPQAYIPDIYERNVNAEAIEQSKRLDKEASTERYDARNSGMAWRPDITANLMDKRLQLGAETDAARENERKSVYEQRNQASLMNLNASNTYNTMEANRLQDFKREKGQESMMMVDRLQDLYKSSIEDKYARLGAENQQKIMKQEADNQFFASFGMSAPMASKAKYDTDFTTWMQANPKASKDDIKKFTDDWKLKNPS